MGDPGEKKYIKKKIRPGAIVLDPRETAIVVQYELEGQLLAPDGVTVITELSDGTKRIKVKTLDRRTDIQAEADEIVTTCKLIHHSKTGKVRSLLAELGTERRTPRAARKRGRCAEVVHDEDARRSRAPAKRRRRVSETANTRDRDAHAHRARADDPAAKTLDAIVAQDRRLLEAKADSVAPRRAPPPQRPRLGDRLERLSSDSLLTLVVWESEVGKTKSMHEHIDISGAFVRRRSRDAPSAAGVARFAAEAKNLETLAAHGAPQRSRGCARTAAGPGHRHECPSGVLRALQRVGVPRPNPR